jgi:hypothetical protein
MTIFDAPWIRRALDGVAAFLEHADQVAFGLHGTTSTPPCVTNGVSTA